MEGGAGRRRFCYPKGQGRAAALVEDVGVWFVVVLGKDGMGVGREKRWGWRWEIGIEVETAVTGRLQKPNSECAVSVSQQSVNTVVLLAGNCWVLT